MKQEIISLWQERIADKKASGLKLKEWCERNQLTTHAYYYWKRKISALNCDSSDVPLFVEITTDTVAKQEATSNIMLIEWKGLSIQVTDIHSVNLAAEFLTKMQKLY